MLARFVPRAQAIAVLVALAVVLAAGAARADKRRVALVNGNDTLERQVRIALATWDLEVRRVQWAAIMGAMPEAATEARKIADANDVDAVVWVADAEQRYSLWVFDVDAGHAVTRPLASGVPTDTADAASLALTVKTLLRSTNAAPPAERIGAGAERPIGALGVLRAEADGGVRFLTTQGGGTEPRFSLTALWLPKFLGQYAGLALGVAAGPGVAVKSSDFTCRFLDFGLTPAVRVRFPIGHFAIEPSVGPTIHFTRLDGAASQRGTDARTTRVDPSLDGSLLVSYSLTRGVDLGVRAGASYLLKYQRYLVAGDPVLELSPVQVSASFVIGARLF
jgi:hypothetical protein